MDKVVSQNTFVCQKRNCFKILAQKNNYLFDIIFSPKKNFFFFLFNYYFFLITLFLYLPASHCQKCWNQMLFSVLGGNVDSSVNFQLLMMSKRTSRCFLSPKAIEGAVNCNAFLNSNCKSEATIMWHSIWSFYAEPITESEFFLISFFYITRFHYMWILLSSLTVY